MRSFLKTFINGLGAVSLVLGGCQSVRSIERDVSPHTYQPWTPIPTAHYDSEETLFVPSFAILKGEHSLIELIEIGLKHNPQTKHAWWRAREAFANKGRADSAFYPRVDISANMNRTQLGKMDDNGSTTRTDNWGPAMNLTYKIFQFGADKAASQSATHLLYAANYEFNRQLQKTVLDIQQAFYNLSSAYAKIEARESSLKDAISSFEAVSKKKENGLARIQDVLQAKSDKLQAEYELQDAKSELESCRANLTTAIGVPISRDFSIQVDSLQSEAPRLLNEVENLMRSALVQRSDLLAQEEKMRASQWHQRAVERGNLPSLNLSTDAQLLKNRHHHKWQRNYGISLGLQWNLFAGFDTQYQELEAYSQMKEQKYLLKQQRLEALQQAWTSFHNFQSSVQLAKAAEALEKAAQETLEVIRIGYDNGINSLLDLLSAQKTLANARLKHVQSKTNVKLSLVQLAYTTGQLDPEKATQFDL